MIMGLSTKVLNLIIKAKMTVIECYVMTLTLNYLVQKLNLFINKERQEVIITLLRVNRKLILFSKCSIYTLRDIR